MLLDTSAFCKLLSSIKVAQSNSSSTRSKRQNFRPCLQSAEGSSVRAGPWSTFEAGFSHSSVHCSSRSWWDLRCLELLLPPQGSALSPPGTSSSLASSSVLLSLCRRGSFAISHDLYTWFRSIPFHLAGFPLEFHLSVNPTSYCSVFFPWRRPMQPYVSFWLLIQ